MKIRRVADRHFEAGFFTPGGRLLMWWNAKFQTIGLFLLLGCQNPMGTIEPPNLNYHPGTGNASKPTSLKLFAGDAQTGTALSVLGTAVEVQVLDQNGNAYEGGTPITFTVLTGSGTVSSSSVTSNGSGRASVVWTLGSTAGTQTLQANGASLEGSPKSITFSATATSGTPVAATSTITGTGPVTANGVATSTITITLKDVSGNLVSGYTPTFSATDTGTTNAYAACSVGVAGVSTCTMTSTKAETKTLSIVTPVAKADGTVVFQAGTPTAGNSTLTILPASVVADGATTIAVTVTLKDANSNLASGKTVTLASSRGATDTVATVSGTTNASGVATFTVKSSTTGAATLTATDTTDTVTVTQTGKALFLAATPLTDYQAQNWDGASNSGNNSSSTKDTWKDLAASATTNDGDLTPSGASNFAFTNSSGWGGDGTTTITSGADGPYRLIFDGSDDWASFGTGVNTNANFSFETWVRPTSSGGLAKAIVSNGATANSGLTTEANTGLTLKQSKAQPGKVELHLGQRSYVDEVLADSPAGFWRLGETSGTMAYDSSGNGRHGVYTNSPTLSQTHSGTWGDSDTSVSFDGTDDLVEIADQPGLRDLTAFTYSAWVNKRASGNTYHAILVKSSFWSVRGMYLNAAAGNLRGYVTHVDLSASHATSNEVLGNGAWYHVAMTYDNAGDKLVRLYLNGVEATYAAQVAGTGASLLSDSTYNLGISDTIASRGFDGFIDEVSIFNTALTGARIAAHYYAGIKRLTCTSSTVFADSTWYHLAGVFNSAGPTLKLMVNGTQECSATLAGAAYTGSGNDLRAGRDQSAANSWTGAVSDLRTWASVLSNTNVVSNYNATSSRFPSFAASDISGLKLWLKADTGIFQDSAGTTAASADSDPVGRWTDQSGTGNNFTQTVAGSRPAYRTNVINGLPVIRFDGTDDKLTGNAFSTMLTASAYTIFTVAKAISVAANGATPHLSRPLISCTGPFFSLSVDATGPTVLLHGHDGNYDYTTQSISTGTFFLASGRHENGYLYLHKDGGVPTTVASGNAGMTTLTIQMGANYDSSYFFNGDIAEMLIYNTVLSESNRKRVEAYLNARFNVY